jgi:hypothetical protein
MHPIVEVQVPLVAIRAQVEERHAQLLGNGVVRSPLNSLAALPTTDELASRQVA